jgi:nicotinate-nucleotide adenylyltransferase
VNIALFGGTFDPVHSGHLAAAQAAQQAFALDQVLLIPARLPPHKQGRPLTPFLHRYAMVALACAGHHGFVPSLLEAGEGQDEPNYSIVTVGKVAAQLGRQDRLYFLVGADAFLEIGEWKDSARLLDSCDFIIVSRPGFSIEKIAEVLPAGLRAGDGTADSIPLRRTRLHLLTTVHFDISSSAIRRLASQGKSLCGLVPDAVGDYIQKLGLFLHEDTAE